MYFHNPANYRPMLANNHVDRMTEHTSAKPIVPLRSVSWRLFSLEDYD